ncbi:unnamed protein product, partial [Closterium sp. NIES-64]
MTIAFIRYDMPENPVAWEPTDQNGVTPHLSSRPPCPLSPSRCRQADPCCPAACIGQMRVGSVAVCTVRGGQSQCVCPGAQAYSAADKQCRACKQDCGMAVCAVKDKAAQCVCPGDLVFDSATTTCKGGRSNAVQ